MGENLIYIPIVGVVLIIVTILYAAYKDGKLRRKRENWQKNPQLVIGLVPLRGKGVYHACYYALRSWKLFDGRIFYPATNGMYGCQGEKLITMETLKQLLKEDGASEAYIEKLERFHKYESLYTLGVKQ